jgi:hypothetical protein
MREKTTQRKKKYQLFEKLFLHVRIDHLKFSRLPVYLDPIYYYLDHHIPSVSFHDYLDHDDDDDDHVDLH